MTKCLEKIKWRPEAIITAIFTIGVMTYIGFSQGIECVIWDTDSYFSAGAVFCNGDIDVYRTPVYPLFCHFWQLICGSADKAYLWIVVTQLAVFVWSQFYFWRIAQCFFRGGLYLLVPNLIYAFFGIYYGFTVITETLSIALLCAVVYNLFRLWRGIGNPIYVNVWIFVYVTVAVFLRPAMLYLVPLVALFYIVWAVNMHRASWPRIGVGLALMACIAGLYIGYCSWFDSRYGFFSPSAIADNNLYFCLAKHDLVDYECVEDPVFREGLQRIGANYPPLADGYTPQATHDVVRQSLANHRHQYWRVVANNITQFEDPALRADVWHYWPLYGGLWAVMAILAFRFVQELRFRAQTGLWPIAPLFLTALCVCIMIVTFTAAPNDFFRHFAGLYAYGAIMVLLNVKKNAYFCRNFVS